MLSFRIINYYTIFRMKHHRCERICIVLLILGHQPAFFCCCQAFLLSSTSTRQKFDSEKSTSRERTTTSLLSLYGKGDNNKIDDGNNHDDNDDDDGMISSKSNRLPALGPVGTSSHTTMTTSLDDYSGSNKTASFVASKFCLQYTCNVCEHRNRLIVSRLAYREGYVWKVLASTFPSHLQYEYHEDVTQTGRVLTQRFFLSFFLTFNQWSTIKTVAWLLLYVKVVNQSIGSLIIWIRQSQTKILKTISTREEKVTK